jgi:hypothetical protein
MLFIYHTTIMIFNTNDDIGRSMRVHGYGYFVSGSPFILYSNFIWGWFLHALPKIGWMYPYYWMTIVVLVVVTWAIIYYLWQRLPWYLAITMAYAAVTYAIITPQFTINAGLLAIAMILALRNYRHSNRTMDLYLAICFGVLSLLIRERQLLLTSMVGVALLPIRHLWHAPHARRALSILLILCISIVTLDRIVHATNPTYVRINQLRSAYDPIEDYQALKYLKQHRQIVLDSGFTFNDLVMISRYFWHNSTFTDLDRLQALNSNIDTRSYMAMNWNSGWQAVSTLQDTVFLSFLVSMMAFALVQKKPHLIIGIGIAMAMIWGFGFVGRGAMMRVTLPLILLLYLVALSAFPWPNIRQRRTNLMLTVACIITLLMQLHVVIRQRDIHEATVRQVNTDLAQVDFQRTLFTGFAVPSTYMYPVNQHFPRYDTHHIAVFNLSLIEPYNTYVETMRDFDGEFTATTGVTLVATRSEIPILQEYCWDRFDGILTTEDTYIGDTLTIRQVRCTNSPIPSRINTYLPYDMIR